MLMIACCDRKVRTFEVGANNSLMGKNNTEDNCFPSQKL